LLGSGLVPSVTAIADPFIEVTCARTPVFRAAALPASLPRNLVLEVSARVTFWPSGRARVIDVADAAVTLPRSTVTVTHLPFLRISSVAWSARVKRDRWALVVPVEVLDDDDELVEAGGGLVEVEEADAA
jgi:hypothetical protein